MVIFLSFIKNSRWEIIKKFNARIFVESGGEIKTATLPQWYEDDTQGIPNKIWPAEIIKEGTQYRTKRLVLRYSPNNNLPSFVRGIAIQRGGMTIERLPAEVLVNEENMGNIYGWLEMDSRGEVSLEQGMKNLCEGPEHFDFSWNTKPAKYLRDYIRSKLREFAKELRIIKSEQAKKSKIQKEAEENALKSLVPLFKKLGLHGKHKGKRRRKPSKRSKDEPLRLSVSDFRLPKASKRVDYGETIEGTYVTPINELDRSFTVMVRVWIVSFDGRTEILEEREINLHHGTGPKIGADSINISKKYQKGGYSFRAKMISLEETDIKLPDGTRIERGTILYDRVNQKFYIECDPPESGPIRFEPKGKDNRNYLFEWEREGDQGYVVFYNNLHPKIKPLLEEGKKLESYLVEQGALLAFQIKLEEMIAENDKSEKELSGLIKSKDLSRVFPTILGQFSEFLWHHLGE